MMYKLLYYIFFVTLITQFMFNINGHVLPESHINMTDSEYNSLISLTFGSLNNEGTVNENQTLDKTTSEISKTNDQTSTIKSINLQSEEIQSTVSINSEHTAEKREVDTKTSSSTESLSPEDDQEGCICVPQDECDPSNRTISSDLEGLLDERSRPCENPNEVLCGCNGPTNSHQEDQIKSNDNKLSSTQTGDNGNGLSQNFNCVCQEQNKIGTDQTHQQTTGHSPHDHPHGNHGNSGTHQHTTGHSPHDHPHGNHGNSGTHHQTTGHSPHDHPHGNHGNSGTNKPSNELHCVCQRRQIYKPAEKTNYGHHHIYKPINKEELENSQQSEELHCVCQHGLIQTTNKWSYGQSHHQHGDSTHSHTSGGSYYNQQGFTNNYSGSSYQTTEGTTYNKHDNTNINEGTSGSTYSNSHSHSSAESHHSGSGYTNSIKENTSDLYQTTDKISHSDNTYNSGTSGSTGTSNSYSHSQSGSHTSGETSYEQSSHSENKDDTTSTSHHTGDQSNYGNQGYTTGTYGNTDTSHSNSQTTDYLSHQQNNSSYDKENGNTGVHDDKHHSSGAEGSTGATHSYSYSHAEAEAHSTAGSSHGQDGHSQSGTTSSLNQHSTDETHGYTFTTESTTNTDSVHSHSHSQSEAHSGSSGTSYSNQDQHIDGHKSSTTSSHHDSDLSNHNQHSENSGSGHIHSSTGIDAHTLSTTDKIDHTKQTSGTYGGTGTTNSYSYSHAEAEAHSSTGTSYNQGGTSYNQGEHTQDHKGDSSSAHHEHSSGVDEISGTTHSIGVTTSSQGNQQHGQDITSQQHTHEQDHNTYGTGGSTSTGSSSTSLSHTQSQSSGGTSYGQDHGQDSTSHTDDKNHGTYSSGTGGSTTGSSSSNSHSQTSSGEISNNKGEHFHEEGSTGSSHTHSDDKKHDQHGSHLGTDSTSSTSSSSYSHSSSNSYSSGGTSHTKDEHSNSHTKDEHSNKQEGSSSHYNTSGQSHVTNGYTSGTGNSGDSHSHSSTGTDYGHTHSNEGSDSASVSHSDSNSQSSSGSDGTTHSSTDQINYGHHSNNYNSSSNHLPTEEPYEFEGCGYAKDPSAIAQRIKSDSPDSESLFGQFPWMVAILTKTKDPIDEHKDKISFVSGGSLIHPKVVMTATHSIIKKDEKKLAVRAGEWNAQANDEILPYQQEDVEKVIRHPDFYSGALYNDISLIIIKKPFHFADNVNIICLPPPNLPIDYSEKCMVSGWGKDSIEKTSKYQSILRQVDLPLVPHQQCQDKLRKTRLGDKFKLHNSFICAGGELNKDSCLGDGGGPLVCPVKGSIERYYQVGIVSWGIGCGTETPAVYANVKSFVKWIDDQMHKFNLKPEYHY